MLTAHKIKVLQSLDKKRFRQKYNLFLVEGNKTISELKQSEYTIHEIFTINEDIDQFGSWPVTQISSAELKKISHLQHPKDSVAVCKLPDTNEIKDVPFNLVMDGIQDPGNLGTMIRLADWFGIGQIVCSEDTVDVYNPKVIQASMGSFARINVVYTNLREFLTRSENEAIGTDMEGENIYTANFPAKLNLVFGNEGNGLRPETEKLLNRRITIPRFGNNQSTESLNVSMAAGIILGQYFAKK